MKIETKYNIGQDVWLVAKNEIVKLRITSVNPIISENIKVIKYGFRKTPYTNLFELIEEKRLFPTKEELLKSL